MNANANHLAVAAIAALAWLTAPSSARASCNLFDDTPCVPSFCSVESGDSCQPDLVYKPHDIVEIDVHSAVAGVALDEINSARDTVQFLRNCWKPPQGVAFDGLLMDVRFAFDRHGAMRAAPNIMFFSPDAPQDAQVQYGLSIREAIMRCRPLPFSARYGPTLEGRLLAVRFVVDSKTR